MDVHKDSTKICIMPAVGEQLLDKVTLPTEEHKLCKYLARWQAKYDLCCIYEAGPGGYVVYRWLERRRIACKVIAPSKTPKAPGDHVKTDYRDARTLALQGRAGTLAAVQVPTPAQEAVRGVVRCREARQRDVQAAKQRILKFMALRGVYYPTGKHWTQAHRRWLPKQSFNGLDAWTYQEYLSDLAYQESRLAEADRQVGALATNPVTSPLIKALCCLRGIDVLSAVVLVAETLDFRRFTGARAYMAYLGLTCRERSSGLQHSQGRITKAGNGRCRRLMVEAGWHYRHAPAVSGRLAKRQAGQPAEVIAHAWLAQQRLHKQFWKLSNRGDDRKAVVAVARELSGFVWGIAMMIESQPG
jgi:transposase